MQARVEADDNRYYVIVESDETTGPVTFQADDRVAVIDQAWHYLQQQGHDSEDVDETLQEALMEFETAED